MNDDNLAVYQIIQNDYKLTEIARAMHKELNCISNVQRQNNRNDKRLYREDNEWQELNYRRNKHMNEVEK